jgi:hypothetical protein
MPLMDPRIVAPDGDPKVPRDKPEGEVALVQPTTPASVTATAAATIL